MNELSCADPGGPIAVRKWIGDVSAERVGHEWRTEDHEAILRSRLSRGPGATPRKRV
jgi:hypothetical protein